MSTYINIENEIQRMLRYTGAPRLKNGVAIDVEAIVRERLDYDVAYIEHLAVRGMRVSGALVPKHKVILVESSDIAERRRFTLAHECAHLILDYRNAESPALFNEIELRSFVCSPDDIEALQVTPAWMKRREALANKFAAGLLMPIQLCRDVLSHHTPIDDCATMLAVSRQAMTIRLAELGLAQST